MKIYLLTVILTVSFFYAPALLADDSNLDTAMVAYQRDMDIVRLRDLAVMGGYIDEYKKKTGKYPFQDVYEGRFMAVLATKEQQKTFDGAEPPPYPHKVIFYNEFVSELERALDKKILFPFDPQRVPSGRQNFYLYMMHGDEYYIAVHLYSPYPFAQKIGKNWYKVEISNAPSGRPLIWSYKDLLANPDYDKAVDSLLQKPDYVPKFRKMIREQVGFN